MKTEVVVLNHQPVPLRPLDEVIDELVAAGRTEALIYLCDVDWPGVERDCLTGWYRWEMGGH